MERKRPYPHFKFPDEITVSIKPIPKENRNWFARNENKDWYFLRTENYGWFPTEILMGVTEGVFNPKHKKSVKHGTYNGWNTGTATIITTKPKQCAETLTKKGYTVQWK